MKKLFTFFLAGLWAMGLTFAQTPTDAWMMKPGEICIALPYSTESWSEYWEGTLKRDNGNIGTFQRQVVMPMFALGITDRINVIGALPWVKTQSTQGQLAGVTGLQDAGLWVKAELLRKTLGKGSLTAHAVTGFSTPVTNYLSDYQPFSLGLGCPDASIRAIGQYHSDKGPFLRAQAGFHYRGNTTIERYYYYTDYGVYSDRVDVPNALTYGVAAGSWMMNNTFRIELLFDGMQTLGGYDIRRQDMPFPSNRMIFTRLGANLQWYVPGIKGLSLLAGGGYVLNGRNVGQSLSWMGGIAYQFPLWK